MCPRQYFLLGDCLFGGFLQLGIGVGEGSLAHQLGVERVRTRRVGPGVHRKDDVVVDDEALIDWPGREGSSVADHLRSDEATPVT